MRNVNDYIRRLSIIAFILLISLIFAAKVLIEELPPKSEIALTTILRQNIRTIRLYPDRGLIFDRYGNILAGNKYEYELYAIPANVKKYLTEQDIDSIINLLGVDSAEVREKLLQVIHARSVLYKPRLIAKYIPPERAAYLQEILFKYPGLYFVKRAIRTYPAHSAAHALG